MFARVIGIALGQATYTECQQFAEGLATVLRALPEPPLLLISSDMNHFASDAATRRLDELALQCMERLDPEALYETCRSRHITMCGMIPAVIVLKTLRRLGKLQRVESALLRKRLLATNHLICVFCHGNLCSVCSRSES